jgi:hypothetical protein
MTTRPAFVDAGATVAAPPPVTTHRWSVRTTSPAHAPATIAVPSVTKAANRAGVPIFTLLLAALAAALLTLTSRKAER